MMVAAPRNRKSRPKRLLPENRRRGVELAKKLVVALHDGGHAPAAQSLPVALAGDLAAVRELLAAAPLGCWGYIALALHFHDVPAPTMRVALEVVGFTALGALCAAVPSIGRLAAMCRHAGAEAPADLPDTFTVWRGVRGMGIKRGSRGLDWTLNRDAACWYATADTEGGVYPLVLTAAARRQNVGMQVGDDLLLYSVEGARTDGQHGGIEEWRAAGAAYRQAAIRAEFARRSLAPAPMMEAHP